MTKLKCSECGGTNIQQKAWVNPNTNEVIDFCVFNQDDSWCNDCEGHTKVILAGTRFYVLHANNDVYPEIHGPFDDPKEHAKCAKKLREEYPFDGLYSLELTNGKVETRAFPRAFFDYQKV